MPNPISGIGLLGQGGEVILFVPPSRRTPTTVSRSGDRIVIGDDLGPISDETYGPLSLECCAPGREIHVVEMDRDGRHGRGFRLIAKD